MILPEVLYSVITNTCPRCHRGKVFENRNPYSFKNGLTMKPQCQCCGLKYERETGFFYGAMYVSYALTSGLFIVIYISDALWIHMQTWLLLTIITSLIIGLSPVAFRWGRIFWLNFFVRYDKRLHEDTKGCAGDPDPGASV